MDSNGGPTEKDSKKENGNGHRASGCPHWSYFLLTAIVTTVSCAVAVLVLPYYLQDDYGLSAANLDPLSCSPTPYTGSLCLLELQDWKSCLPERQNDSNVFIPSDVDQQLREEQAQLLFTGLQLLSPSEECQKEFMSFWCLLLFGICDGSDQRRLPSFDQCFQLQTMTCTEIIQIASTVPEYAVVIQNCNNFRLNVQPCRNESEVGVQIGFNVTCSDQFYYDENSLVCKPKCGVWTHLSSEAARAFDLLAITGDVASVVICIAIFLLSIVQYKKIFTFPSVLMMYPTLAVLLVAILDLFSFLPIDSHLCSSDDFLENISSGKSSTFVCKLKGSLFLYTALAISIFWLFQTIIYFWVVIYPLHYRSFNSTGKMKYIHILIVAISFIFPVIPLLPVDFTNGFGISIFLPNHCTPLSIDNIVYGIVFPIDVIVIFGISLLVITVWCISDMKNRLQRKSSLRQLKLKSTELKLIIMIVHYLLVGFYTLAAANATLRNVNAHERVLYDHFLCEALGDEAIDCSREGFGQLQRDSFVQLFIQIWFNIYPSVFFIFLINPKRLYKKSSSAAPLSTSVSTHL